MDFIRASEILTANAAEIVAFTKTLSEPGMLHRIFGEETGTKLTAHVGCELERIADERTSMKNGTLTRVARERIFVVGMVLARAAQVCEASKLLPTDRILTEEVCAALNAIHEVMEPFVEAYPSQ